MCLPCDPAQRIGGHVSHGDPRSDRMRPGHQVADTGHSGGAPARGGPAGRVAADATLATVPAGAASRVQRGADDARSVPEMAGAPKVTRFPDSAARFAACAGICALLSALTAGPAYGASSATTDTVQPLPTTSTSCLPAPTSSDSAVPWAQQQLAPQRVWPLTRGAGVTVGVVDTGVDAATPQLAGRVRSGTDVSTAVGGAANTDCYGHGTFVAGIIAAAPAAGTGFAGVAPDATILPVRWSNGAGNGSADTLAQGIRVAVDSGASVINVSASTDSSTPTLAAAVDYAAAHGVLIVAAAANGAHHGDAVTYPAWYPTVLAVGAIDSTGAHADFSQTGPYLGLVAPGVNVVSIGPGGDGQWEGNGTSYAAPFVSGVASLVRAYHPGLTAAQVRQRLLVTADHPAATLPATDLGWGTVNPMAAVTAVLPDEAAGVATVVSPSAAQHPALVEPDRLGVRLAVLAWCCAVGLVLLVGLAMRAWPAGRRRRWRAPRVALVRPDQAAEEAAPVPSWRSFLTARDT